MTKRSGSTVAQLVEYWTNDQEVRVHPSSTSRVLDL